jgi:hypothetical protein
VIRWLYENAEATLNMTAAWSDFAIAQAAVCNAVVFNDNAATVK